MGSVGRLMTMMMVRSVGAVDEGGAEGLQPRLSRLHLPEHGAEFGAEPWLGFRGYAALIGDGGSACRADRLNHANFLGEMSLEADCSALYVAIKA